MRLHELLQEGPGQVGQSVPVRESHDRQSRGAVWEARDCAERGLRHVHSGNGGHAACSSARSQVVSRLGATQRRAVLDELAAQGAAPRDAGDRCVAHVADAGIWRSVAEGVAQRAAIACDVLGPGGLDVPQARPREPVRRRKRLVALLQARPVRQLAHREVQRRRRKPAAVAASASAPAEARHTAQKRSPLLREQLAPQRQQLLDQLCARSSKRVREVGELGVPGVARWVQRPKYCKLVPRQLPRKGYLRERDACGVDDDRDAAGVHNAVQPPLVPAIAWQDKAGLRLAPELEGALPHGLCPG
mmetsp:Transcript_38073/g.108864  ORF Transcript_38073/g.108864 Transcript_38073/m.108864 type:complete len:303 (-) Transcript_38073:1595-2503(-)